MITVNFEYNDISYQGSLNGNTIEYKNIQGKPHYIDINEVKILPPSNPSKIVAVGLNYSDHAAELSMDIPSDPIIFLKPSTSVIGHKDKIIYPSISERVDHEAELGLIIGKTAKNVSRDDWKDYILGFTCFNDITARDIQKSDGQWTRAKSFDTFAPFGPFLVDDIDISALRISSYVNGRICQDSNTKNMIFKVPELVEYISAVMTLNPGDVITTGTPSNVGPVNKGDTVEIKIEKIGSLINYIE